MLQVLGRPREDLKAVVSVVGQEGFAEVRELNALRVFDVEIADKGLYFGLRVVDLHREEAGCELQLRDVALAVEVEGSESVHNVEVWAPFEEHILLMLD